MEGRMPVSRRKARSWRITVAVGALSVATLMVAGALVTGDLLVVGSAGVVALVGGWVALRLAWSGVVQSRFEHAVDRTELARVYRKLFSERSVEHQTFVAEMTSRLTQRDQMIRDLEGTLVGIEMRAIEAETTASTFRRRLTDAEGQIASMEELITAASQALAQKQAEDQAADSSKPPLLGRKSETLRDSLVPEWADMEVDVVAALVAWEEHASHLAGRHSADEQSAQQA